MELVVWLLGMLFSGRCLHLKQYIPSCALSHQVNPSLKIGCCIMCVFNAGYFEEFCKTFCSNRYDLTVYYMECYNLNPQFRCMKYIIHDSFSILLYSCNFHPCNKNGFSCCLSWLLQNTKVDLGYKSRKGNRRFLHCLGGEDGFWSVVYHRLNTLTQVSLLC